MRWTQQFNLLLWKNYVLQKRRPVATAVELLLPILFSAILIAIRSSVTLTEIDEITTWREFSVDHLPSYSFEVLPIDNVWNVAYVPENVSEVNEIMQMVQRHLNTDIPPTELERTCRFDMKTLASILRSSNASIVSNSSRTQQQNSTRPSSSGAPSQNGSASGPPDIQSIIACISQNSRGNRGDRRDDDDDSMTDSDNSANGSVNFEALLSTLELVPKIRLLPFSTEEEFLQYVANDTNLKSTLAGIIFGTPNHTFDGIPDDLHVTLRFHSDPITAPVGSSSLFSGLRNTWHTTMLFPDFQAPYPRSNKSYYGGIPYYYKEGFLSLLHAVNLAIGNVVTNSSGTNRTDDITFGMKRYPYPPYVNDVFIIAIQNTLPLMIMLSFFYTSLVIVRSIVREKESKLKEYMIMMGLSNWLHWFAWFIKYFLFLSISCVIMSSLFKVKVSKGSILTYSDYSVVLVFFLLFSIATINFCFLISVFFSKANVGAAAGGVIYALSYMPYLFISNDFSSLSTPAKMATGLVSNIAMASGWNLVGLFEGKGSGVQWSTIHQGVTIDDSFSMLHVFLMLILDSILYMLLTLYIEGVWPGEYGLPKPWYFPFTRTYWKGPKKATSEYKLITNVDVEEAGATSDLRADREYFEPYPTDLNPTVKIKGLRKVYKVNNKERVAVHNLHLNMYDGQITVLLGHNGAGKTTTMSMLTGFFPPTSGDAIVNGHSITNDIKGVRESMGLCPQFNILFDLLTVDEHIYFFARLKGLNKQDALKEVEDAKLSLKLIEKGSTQSRYLSGGMKRKLSVGIALCAGSKYIILDEPTSGMDPAARRAIWDVLQLYRHKCSMLLSTHFMDEADLLGDRIAIMAAGRLRCAGSPVFLKNKFGVGYHIVLTRSPDCDITKLTQVIQSHVPETRLERLAGAELSFVLPFQASPHFPKLFRELDDRAASLGIAGYGAIVTTLEEVFLRVTEDSFTAVSKISNKVTNSYVTICRSQVMPANGGGMHVPQIVEDSGAFLPEAFDSTTDGQATRDQLVSPSFNRPPSPGLSVHTGVDIKSSSASLTLNRDTLDDAPAPGLSVHTGVNIKSSSASLSLNGDPIPVNDSASGTPFPSNGVVQTPRSQSKKISTKSVQFVSGKMLNTGATLWCQQFYALLVKKMLHSRRNYKVATAQLIVPVFFAVLAILSVKYPPFERKNVALYLGLDSYGPNDVYVSNLQATTVGTVYRQQFEGTKATGKLYEGSDLETFLADLYGEEGGDFNTNHLVSASFNNSNGNSTHAIAWFNNQAYHTPASSIAYMDQAYLRYTTNRNFSMSYFNYPLPRNSTKRVQQQLLGSLSGFFVGFFIVLGFSFLSASFCLFLVRERVDRSALLQTLAGVEPFCFWFSAFVWDFINYIMPCAIIIVMFYAFDVPEFYNHVGITLLLFTLYCFSSLPLMYLLSFFFDVPSTALVRVTMLNVIIGAASVITVNFLRLLDLTDVANGLNWFFLFMPPYCLGLGLADIYVNDRMVSACLENVITKAICDSMNITYQSDFMAWEAYGVGKYAAFMAIQAFIFFSLLFLLEFQVHKYITLLLPLKRKNVVTANEESEEYDDDVAMEARRINELDQYLIRFSDQLILSNLSKVYGGKLLAVDKLSLGIPKGECFGLLGINGAGKTTTFKMLTGDHQPSSGTAYLDGYDVTQQQRKAQQRMGYCPQFDGLIEQMTGAETVRMFARLRGVREADIPRCIADLGTSLHFAEHLDKECGKYSGGNKRKLSTAIALVGDPPVVLLDEPSTGMDPGARRMLWDALTSVRTSGRSIVITSHSMEECEALCTRIGIMVNGQLRCLGGPQHLKNKFGQGFTAEITSQFVDVKSVMKRYFPESELKDEHSGILVFGIPEVNKDQSKLNLATVFELMEKAKNEAQFGNYTITQTTLEQVFLRLVRWQRESTE